MVDIYLMELYRLHAQCRNLTEYDVIGEELERVWQAHGK
jgi:hypothetical protein